MLKGQRKESRNLKQRQNKNNIWISYTMSSLVNSSHSLPMEEVVPRAASVQGLTRSSILTARRRVRAAPQTGVSYGASGAGGASSQIQFVIADQGGLLDPASIALVYNIKTTGTGNEVPDDGHPFTRMQISLNGQMLEDNAQAAKTTNAEVKLASTKSWYQSSGSFCGFELLNNELGTGTATATPTAVQQQQYGGAWCDVSGNTASQTARTDNATTYPVGNPLGGEQRSLPLGLISGVGRMKQYLPLSVLGELNLTLYTGSKAEVLFQLGAGTNADFSLGGVYIEYDIVVGHPEYMNLIARVANDPSEQGLVLPFESTIMTSSGTIAASITALVENSIVVSRATNHLVRTFLIQQPTSYIASTAYPCQSCFQHNQTNKVQWRVGSMYYPQIPAEGDASIWNMTALAYGSASLNTATSVINRVAWAQTTAVPPVAANAASATYGTEGPYRYNFADSFLPAYGFQNVKGDADPLAVDGISLSGASGSQLVCVVTNAPALTTTPTLGLVALRFIQAQAGSVRVQGA